MLNKIILIGRLTKDPELRYTKQDSTAVAKFRIACDRDYKRNNEKITDFIDVEAWKQKAEFVSQYFRKGMLVDITGRLECDVWMDQNNTKRQSYKIVASELHFVESKKSEDMNDLIANSTPFSSEIQNTDPFSSEELYPDPFAA